jgi:hypothetical protein
MHAQNLKQCLLPCGIAGAAEVKNAKNSFDEVVSRCSDGNICVDDKQLGPTITITPLSTHLTRATLSYPVNSLGGWSGNGAIVKWS